MTEPKTLCPSCNCHVPAHWLEDGYCLICMPPATKWDIQRYMEAYKFHSEYLAREQAGLFTIRKIKETT